MSQLTRKIPYLTTKINATQSRMDIEKMLKESGINDTRWTSIDNRMTLEFIWKFEEEGTKKQIAFKVEAPTIKIKGYAKAHDKGSGIIFYRREDVEMRVLWWWLKSKLDAVYFNLESMEQAMMSQIMIPLPNGETTTVGALISKAIKTDAVQALKALPGTVSLTPVLDWKKKQIIEVTEQGEIIVA